MGIHFNSEAEPTLSPSASPTESARPPSAPPPRDRRPTLPTKQPARRAQTADARSVLSQSRLSLQYAQQPATHAGQIIYFSTRNLLSCSNSNLSNSPPLSLSQGGGRPVALPTPCPTAGPISHASPAARIPLPRSEAAKVDNGQCAANGGHAWACPGAQLRSRSRPAHALFTVGTLPIIRVSTRPPPSARRKGGASAHCGGGVGVAPMTDEKMPPAAGACESRV